MRKVVSKIAEFGMFIFAVVPVLVVPAVAQAAHIFG